MGGFDGTINKYQQRGKPRNHCSEMPAHCFARLRALGGIFGWEKYIFGFRVINNTYWAFVHALGRVQWGGLQWMGSDDDIPIRKVLPFRDVRISPALCLLLGTVFHGKKGVY